MKNNLRNLRERRNLTLQEVAEKTNINFSTIARMETESQSIMDYNAIILADFFHCSLDYLFARNFQIPEKNVQEISPETVLPELHKWNLNQLSKMSGALELEVLNRLKQAMPSDQQNGNGKKDFTTQGKGESNSAFITERNNK